MAPCKKVKLVTFAPNLNFGTCLQSYALNSVLRSKGCDVQFIYNGRENPPLPLAQRLCFHLSSALPPLLAGRLKKLIAGRAGSVSDEPHVLTLPDDRILGALCKIAPFKTFYDTLKYRAPRMKKVYKFAFKDGNFNMRRLYTKADYKSVVDDADLFVTASDQIWNPFCGGFNPMMFLEFAEDKKRVAYSSSIAVDSFPKNLEERAKADLSKFSYIGVREKPSVGYLNRLLGRQDVRLVVDPTLLLTKEAWLDFAARADMEIDVPDSYLFCYFVGSRNEDYRRMVADVRAKTGIGDVITLSCYGDARFCEDSVPYNAAGPYEFVRLISRASAVCTDSFHATMFAMKFGVDFVHILKSKNDASHLSQNGRMYDILERYGLLNKLYGENSVSWLDPVDFDKLWGVMGEDIGDSMRFLDMEISA